MSTSESAIDPNEAALNSLTSALVDANDRLLGLLALITDEAPTSLDIEVLIDAIVDRAARILHLDRVKISGGITYRWGQVDPQPAGLWVNEAEVPDHESVVIEVARYPTRFDTGDAKLLGAVAKLVVSAISTAHMHRQALDQALVAKEHATAARITTAALPKPGSEPQVSGVSMFADLVPARTAGGDLYAWREIDGRLWFALGDVSGKGLPAAVQMSMVTYAIDAAFERLPDSSPEELVDEVSRWVHGRLSDSAMFVTLMVGHFDPDTATLTIANSGHSPIVFCRAGETNRLEATAPPVGVVEGLTPTPQSIKVQADDLLVIATDGFTEQDNSDGEMYGEDRFDETISTAAGTAVEVGEMLLDELATHGEGCEQADDRTLMVLRFT